MTETVAKQRWMKHREKQGVWHLAVYSIDAYVTACRGDMLYGAFGPILQQFDALPLGAKCVRCTKLWLESNKEGE